MVAIVDTEHHDVSIYNLSIILNQHYIQAKWAAHSSSDIFLKITVIRHNFHSGCTKRCLTCCVLTYEEHSNTHKMDQEYKEHPDSYFCFQILLLCIWIVERISGSCTICWEELWLSSADCSWLHCVCSAGWSAEAPWETKTIWPKVSK